MDSLPVDADGVAPEMVSTPCSRKATAIAIGPGLGVGKGAARLLASLLERWSGPLLLDADALTLLAERPNAPPGARRRRGDAAPGELARMLGATRRRWRPAAWTPRAACRAPRNGPGQDARTIVAEADGAPRQPERQCGPRFGRRRRADRA